MHHLADLNNSTFRTRSRNNRGSSVLEILVVVGLCSLLIALLLPAVQSARESARKAQCLNQLRQIAQAIHSHESTHRFLPSGGWGWKWVGDPDRGVGLDQPGGWIYQILPEIDRPDLARLGSGLPEGERKAALGHLTATNLALVRCPTRSAPVLASPFQYRNADPQSENGRTDYAINAGSVFYDDPAGPQTLEPGDEDEFEWPPTSQVNGICYLRSQLNWKNVSRGLSNTFLVGEKYVSTNHYMARGDAGYDQSPFSGADVDLHRWTEFPPSADTAVVDRTRFGSAHSQAFQMAYCDGSVRSLNYNMDVILFRSQGTRDSLQE